mmetsp:Transcript_113244/g.320523  ORF Transcript_113244/g.320523 Transcript_113244/m.320523 type:complete len:289 (+) Transcript_113244:979-1845(+)
MTWRPPFLARRRPPHTILQRVAHGLLLKVLRTLGSGMKIFGLCGDARQLVRGSTCPCLPSWGCGGRDARWRRGASISASIRMTTIRTVRCAGLVRGRAWQWRAGAKTADWFRGHRRRPPGRDDEPRRQQGTVLHGNRGDPHNEAAEDVVDGGVNKEHLLAVALTPELLEVLVFLQELTKLQTRSQHCARYSRLAQACLRSARDAFGDHAAHPLIRDFAMPGGSSPPCANRDLQPNGFEGEHRWFLGEVILVVDVEVLPRGMRLPRLPHGFCCVQGGRGGGRCRLRCSL